MLSVRYRPVVPRVLGQLQTFSFALNMNVALMSLHGSTKPHSNTDRANLPSNFRSHVRSLFTSHIPQICFTIQYLVWIYCSKMFFYLLPIWGATYTKQLYLWKLSNKARWILPSVGLREILSSSLGQFGLLYHFLVFTKHNVSGSAMHRGQKI